MMWFRMRGYVILTSHNVYIHACPARRPMRCIIFKGVISIIETITHPSLFDHVPKALLTKYCQLSKKSDLSNNTPGHRSALPSDLHGYLNIIKISSDIRAILNANL